jgi:exosortase J
LPLQYFDAQVARSFASLLGVPVSGDSLRLMFEHNRLGMMIAPGCDGFSGAAAMGYATLIASYLYGVRPFLRALYALAAVLLAFALNLARLCSLVLFYCVAHTSPRSQVMRSAPTTLSPRYFSLWAQPWFLSLRV